MVSFLEDLVPPEFLLNNVVSGEPRGKFLANCIVSSLKLQNVPI